MPSLPVQDLARFGEAPDQPAAVRALLRYWYSGGRSRSPRCRDWKVLAYAG
jgi:hypothetical protein